MRVQVGRRGVRVLGGRNGDGGRLDGKSNKRQRMRMMEGVGSSDGCVVQDDGDIDVTSTSPSGQGNARSEMTLNYWMMVEGTLVQTARSKLLHWTEDLGPRCCSRLHG